MRKTILPGRMNISQHFKAQGHQESVHFKAQQFYGLEWANQSVLLNGTTKRKKKKSSFIVSQGAFRKIRDIVDH